MEQASYQVDLTHPGPEPGKGEGTLDCVIMTDQEGTILAANACTTSVLGHRPEALCGRQWTEALLPEHERERWRGSLSGQVCTGAKRVASPMELKISRANGEELPAVLLVTPVAVDGKILFSLQLRDLTGQQQAEALKARLAAIVSSSDDAIIGKDLQGVITSWNQGAERIYGYTTEEILGQSVSVLMPPEQADDFPAIMARVRRGEAVDHYQTRRRAKDGRLITVSLTVSPIKNSSGEVVGASAVARDVTEQAHLEEARRHLAAIVESSDDAIVGKDMEGIITSWNKGAERIYGYTAREVIGRPISLLMPPERASEFQEIMQRLRRGETIDHYETLRQTKSGRIIPVSLSASLIKDAFGRIVGASAIARDITRLKEEEKIREQLREMELESERVREASRMKSEFLANMSHELRTPLNGIIGFTEFLVDQKPGPLNPKQLEYLGDILNSAHHLLQLINDILDLSKVEAGRMEFHAEPFAVGEKLQEVCSVLRPMIDKKHLKLQTRITLEPPRVRLDAQKFKQVLYNLLSNAVKFTRPAGRVEVQIAPEASARLRLEVSDNGIGISVEEQKKLFVEFHQIDSTLGRANGGTGLGLALCKRMIELQGGSIAVQSEPEKGSTFTVILPCEFPEH